MIPCARGLLPLATRLFHAFADARTAAWGVLASGVIMPSKPSSLAFVLACLGAVSLFACGSQGSDTLPTDDPQQPDKSAEDGSTGAPRIDGSRAPDAAPPGDAESPRADVDAQSNSPAGPSTGGRGGLSCKAATTANTAQPYCLATVGDIEMKVLLPAASKGPMQIAVFLHGDSANGYFEDWGFEALATWASARGILFVAALAPNRCSWWRPKSSCSVDEYDTGENARALVAALDAIGKAYDVYPRQLLFVGYSGGSTFLTRNFIPMFGDTRWGSMVLNCGGVDPQPFDWAPTAAALQRLPLAYTYGSLDKMLPYIGPSVAEYKKLGFQVDDRKVDGYTHCDSAYDWDARTIALWEKALVR